MTRSIPTRAVSIKLVSVIQKPSKDINGKRN